MYFNVYRYLPVVAAACSAPPRAPQIAAVLDAYGNYGAVLSPDGRLVAFRSDRGSAPELYLAEVGNPDAPARRLVAGPERIASVTFTADGKALLFRRDTGADENFHIWKIDIDGTNPVDLTPGEPLWRDSPIVRGATIIYGARHPRDYASMAVVDGKVVFQDTGAATVIDVDADATHALWWREAATGGHEVLEIELATGTTRPIATDAAQLTYAAYSTDGKAIYIATDHGTEAHVVEALERRSLAVTATYHPEPATAEVAAIVPSPHGDRIAVLVDRGYRTEGEFLDARTLAKIGGFGSAELGTNNEIRVRLGGNAFSADGAKLVIGTSDPNEPDDIAIVDEHGVTKLRNEPRLPALQTRMLVDERGVRSFDGLAIPTNIYVPSSAGRRRPVIVRLHGGPDAATPIGWDAWNRIFVEQGYVVLEPNIRGSTGFGRAYARADDQALRWNAVKDLEAINRWARTQPWCDPDRISIEGASFGGYYTLMALAYQPALWHAGIDLAGPSDLELMMSGDAVPQRYVEELGTDHALLRALSPVHAADQIRAPLLVYQGTNDAHVPRAHADEIVAALRRHGVRVEYMLVGDEGHSVSKRANEEELVARMLAFLGRDR